MVTSECFALLQSNLVQSPFLNSIKLNALYMFLLYGYYYRCFQIELARNYNHESFFEDLRKLYFSAGARNESTVFLFSDTQIVEEEFLEDINNILNSGWKTSASSLCYTLCYLYL